jgi:predicted Zn-dependent protease
MIRKIVVVVLALSFLYSCATVPVTGRKQLSLVSSAEINQMSEQQYREVIAKGPLSNNQEQTEMVRRVGVRIQKAVEKYMADKGASSQLAGFNWEFNLIQDDKTVNAWCMPGGKVAFYTAILPICKDESGVAVVMGHEVAHAIANHGAERMWNEHSGCCHGTKPNGHSTNIYAGSWGWYQCGYAEIFKKS